MTFFSKNTFSVVKRLGSYIGCYQNDSFFQTVRYLDSTIYTKKILTSTVNPYNIHYNIRVKNLKIQNSYKAQIRKSGFFFLLTIFISLFIIYIAICNFTCRVFILKFCRKNKLINGFSLLVKNLVTIS